MGLVSEIPYKIVFFDIDGTLMNEEGVIRPDTSQSIQKLQDSGVKIVLATGRSPFHLKQVADELGINSYVSFNGSYVFHEGQLIVEKRIPDEMLRLLEEHTRKMDHPLVYIGDDGCYASHDGHPDILSTFQLLSLQLPTYSPGIWRTNAIRQVMLYCNPDEENHYRQTFSGVKFVRWHKLSVDVIPTDGSKAVGVASILDSLGISPSEAVAFGDGLNDCEMLTYVGMGIAMGNAHEELKRYAKFTTKSINDGGIRYGLQQIGLI